jgi:hypothetical protein
MSVHFTSLHLFTLNPHLKSLACNYIFDPLSKRLLPGLLTKSLHVHGDTKKRELLKNPTKIEEILQKKFIDRN